MRDLEADHGDSDPRRPAHRLDRTRDRPCERQQAREQRLGKVKDVVYLDLRNDKRVALTNRPDIEKREEVGVLPQDNGLEAPARRCE